MALWTRALHFVKERYDVASHLFELHKERLQRVHSLFSDWLCPHGPPEHQEVTDGFIFNADQGFLHEHFYPYCAN